MSEDERYRTSTQYRLWSYTPASLSALRAQTNSLAAERVRAAVQRAREARALSSADTSEAENGNEGSSNATPTGEVECLTPEEELKLLRYYCGRTIAGGDHLNLPTDVKATAVQYLKRFYITNSIMTYAPTDILKTALFFATKTENHYYRLSRFAADFGNNTKAEDVLASEFLLTQGLRFTFDVRHPFRALEGACMEISAIAGNDIPVLPNGHGGNGIEKPENLAKRNRAAHGKAREYLKTSALITDAYFHFTPSQIMMAALSLADSELAEWYISIKFPANPEAQELKEKVIATVQKCADMLRTVEPSSDFELSPTEKKEISAASKKLKKCRNPEKIDLVGLQKAKREGEEEPDERTVKKRKLERERSEREGQDLFGPSLQKP